MKKLMMVAAVTVAAWCSWGAESISVDKVANHYPWDGKVDCVVTVSGAKAGYLYDGAFHLSVEKNGETVRRVVTNTLGTVAGTYTNTFDCTALFGAGFYPNGGISVALLRYDCVQLWAGGPYFAKFNLGATQPQESGYYFWWGDTVGYKRNTNNDGWISVKDETEFSFDTSNCPTYDKNASQLRSEGWINETNALVAAHDAVTAHLGAPWRMMTEEELRQLVDANNCMWTWTSDWNGTGVAGTVVTGVQSGYTDKSIFLPAVGRGKNSGLEDAVSYGYYWSSKPPSVDSNTAWALFFKLNEFLPNNCARFRGQPVRPVRSAK